MVLVGPAISCNNLFTLCIELSELFKDNFVTICGRIKKKCYKITCIELLLQGYQ